MNESFTFGKYGGLLAELVTRDIKIKYRRSVLGVLWSLLNPLLTMIVTAMIFSNLFRFDITNFPLYLLCGQIVITFYSESTSFAMSSIIGNGILIKKIRVPKWIFPLSRVVSSCVNLLFTLPALFLIMIFTTDSFPVASLTFFIPLILMVFFCLGVGMVLATIAVYFRDTFHLYGVFLSMLGYATPVFYPESIVPDEYLFLFHLNPLYYFLKAFRQPLYEGIFPDVNLILICAGLAIAAMILGFSFFRKYQNNFILYI